jgi:hypothetical protein
MDRSGGLCQYYIRINPEKKIELGHKRADVCKWKFNIKNVKKGKKDRYNQ